MTHRLTSELRKLQRDSHDKCSSCGRSFHEADTAHAGYSIDGAPLYVGSCCEVRLAETAVRYYWQARAYEVPDGEAPLWRYMDFSKFVALLNDQALYFARADSLGDRWEGAKGAAANKQQWDEHYLRSFREVVRNPPPGVEFTLSEEEVDKEAQRLLDELGSIGKYDLRTTYVSCWHEAEVESEALWRLYCPPQSAGIAIRTTFSALTASLEDDPSISIGRVRYIDFRKSFADVNDAIFRKRQSLSHEKEVRAVIRVLKAGRGRGIRRPVELAHLLKTVVMSPFGPPWLEAVLWETMNRFGVNAPIVASELILEPFF
jgi:hypothetical protein